MEYLTNKDPYQETLEILFISSVSFFNALHDKCMTIKN